MSGLVVKYSGSRQAFDAAVLLALEQRFQRGDALLRLASGQGLVEGIGIPGAPS